MSAGVGDMIVGWVVQLGIPGAVLTTAAAAVRAYSKRRTMQRNAPEIRTDTSMSRMAQAAIVTDGLIDNLNDALEVQTRRAEAAEAREAALSVRLVTMQQQLDAALSSLASVQRQLNEIRRQHRPTPGS